MALTSECVVLCSQIDLDTLSLQFCLLFATSTHSHTAFPTKNKLQEVRDHVCLLVHHGIPTAQDSG